MSKRYVARVVIEATTPIKSASGKNDIFTDAPVIKDWNNLPMILGSSLAGVLRASFKKDISNNSIENEIFGYQEKKSDKGHGSYLIVSDAYLLDSNSNVRETLETPSNLKKDSLLKHYFTLPVREHTAIEHTGVAKKHSKFDEEIVYKGSRFKFELELIDNQENHKEHWQTLLKLLKSPLFRLGGGSSKGFGAFKVIKIETKEYNFSEYKNKSTSLNEPLGDEYKDDTKNKDTITKYKIALEPENFYIFGAGFGDKDVDDTYVTERIIEWDSQNKPEPKEQQILFPASSLKGALSHRVAFHYNKDNKIFADEKPLEDFEKYIGSNNNAVADIFGKAKNRDSNGSKGKIIISDMYKSSAKEKIFDHVKIDRFTGGAVDSALYNEKVITHNKNDKTWYIEILLNKELNEDAQKALEATLNDLCNGLLPLGGKVNRGHGVFLGSWTKEPKEKGDNNE